MVAQAITRFTEKYRFLSNFYPCKVKYENILYPSSEHAYQAAKCEHPKDKRRIAHLDSAGEAKQYGRRVAMIKDFEKRKAAIMKKVVLAKFTQNKDLAEKLVATYPAKLEEGNNWGDTTWGTVNGVGHNLLGLILMDVRKELRSSHV